MDTPLLKNGMYAILHAFFERSPGQSYGGRGRYCHLLKSDQGGSDPAKEGEGYQPYPPSPMVGGYDRFETQKGCGVSCIPPSGQETRSTCFLPGPGDSQYREPGIMRTGLPKMRNTFI